MEDGSTETQQTPDDSAQVAERASRLLYAAQAQADRLVKQTEQDLEAATATRRRSRGGSPPSRHRTR